VKNAVYDRNAVVFPLKLSSVKNVSLSKLF